MNTSTEGAVSLVTGSVRGLGLATARAMRARGDLVHVVWRTPGELADARKQEFGERAHRADVLDERDLERLVREVLAIDGRLDHVVHAVGEYLVGPLADLSPADFRRMLASNAESGFLIARATRAALRSSRGSLVFFGCAGLGGLRARRTIAAYVAAKSALLVLARSLAVEEGPHGVRVNLVSPGHVPHEHASEGTRDPKLWDKIPFRRPGRPEEVASAILWLCSREASYVTGSNIEVGGGWML